MGWKGFLFLQESNVDLTTLLTPILKVAISFGISN
jgi:hypothetical protein